MKSLLAYFIKYPIWTNVIKIFIAIFGIIALLSIKFSFFPEIERKIIFIQIVYPGASPEEVEQGVVQKIEDNLKGILGIERYVSTSKENTATITIEVYRSFDVDEVLQEVKNAVDRIPSFPAGMEPPVIFKAPQVDFALSFSISGDVDLFTLKRVAQQIEQDLRQNEGISQISLSGFPNEEITIYVNEKTLRKYGLSFDNITRAVRSANQDITAGNLKTSDEELVIRLKDKSYYAEELLDIPVKTAPDGSIIKLREIADVRNVWADVPQRIYVDGNPAVVINVSKVLGEDILKIKNKVINYVNNFNQKNEKIKATVLDDITINLQQRLNLLINNGLVGALLVLLSLTLFINLRLALWVALSIPFSFLGMFLAGYLFGITINVISLFGCIVVIGMLVDNSIVVSEQSYQYSEKGMNPYLAALNGSSTVAVSVFFAVLTTIVMFIPLFFLEGRSGTQMPEMAFVVIAALIFSLIEALFILPVHLAHSKALRQNSKRSKIREFLDKALAYPRDKWYNSTLRFFIKNKILIFAIALFMTLITIGAFQGGIIGATFFPFLDADTFEISLVMPAGTRENKTFEILDKIEKATWEVNEELKKKYPDRGQIILHTRKAIGIGATSLFGAVEAGGANVGTLRIYMLSGEERNLDSYIIINAIRDKVGPVYEAEKLVYGEGSIFGKPISLSLVGSNLNDLERAKDELKEKMRTLPDLRDITDNDPQGLREIIIKPNAKAHILGLTNLEIARQIRQGFFGDEVQRLQRGIDEIKVWVKYSDEERSTLQNFEKMRIRTPGGQEYPLIEIADYTIQRGSISINHLNGMREIKVEADLADQTAEVPPILNKVKNEMLKEVLHKYPSVTTALSGQEREITKTAVSSRTALPVALVAWFILIILSFRSYSYAVIVVMLVPLGFIGAAWGHFIQGMPISIMSAYGFLALMGVIVNNSIVFINTMNDYLRSGLKFEESIIQSAKDRFRPILLTTFTTFLGLFPLLYEKSRQAQFLKPMAASVAYGLLFGTILTLFFLPVFLLIFNKIKVNLKKLITGVKPEPEEVEPAIKEKIWLEKNSADIK